MAVAPALRRPRRQTRTPATPAGSGGRRLGRALATLAALAAMIAAVETPAAPSEPARRTAEPATGAVPSQSRQAALKPRRERRHRSQTMREGGGVRAPYGYERFCARDVRYCAPPETRRPGAMAPASRDMIARLAAFNRSVNAEFEPSEDIDIYGVSDHWTFPAHFADCEDYVLAKQSRLLAAGWPREALLIGVVVGEESPFHAVLIVRTTAGEFVLDNMTDEVLDWRDTGYTWVVRQSTQRPERWVQILPEKG